VPRNLALDSTRFLTLFEMTMALAPQLDRIKWSNHQRAYERMCSGEFGRCCRFCEHAFVVEDLVQLGLNPSAVTAARIRLFYCMICQFKPPMDFRHDVLVVSRMSAGSIPIWVVSRTRSAGNTALATKTRLPPTRRHTPSQRRLVFHTTASSNSQGDHLV
jgi:hypothetical protein